MKRHKSEFVCLRCGVAVHIWGKTNGDESYWKHSNGWRSGLRSCGKPPKVTTREKYERLLTR